MTFSCDTRKYFHYLLSYFKGFVHLFYPHVCLQCASEILSSDQIICTQCELELPYTHFELMENSPVEKIFWGRIKLYEAISILFYTKDSIIQKILIELKYKQNKKAGYLLGKLIAHVLTTSNNFNQNVFLIPIPISKKSQRKRGYNQSKLICESIVMHGFCVPIYEGLIKTSHATTQTQKNRVQRGKHLKDNFKLIDCEILENKDIIIIDDVLTTGATIEAAYHCLLKAKPKSISIVTAAYTLD